MSVYITLIGKLLTNFNTFVKRANSNSEMQFYGFMVLFSS